jgi:hypothetical protein
MAKNNQEAQMSGRTLAAAAVLILLSAPSSARAQFNQYWLPVEQGVVDSHIDVQLQYSRHNDVYDLEDSTDNIAVLSVEAQYAFKDRFEVGLGIPVVAHNYGAGVVATEGTGFGNIMLNLKARLFGLGDMLSVAAYTNVMLPTHSEADDRDYSMILAGGAVSAKLLGIRLGGGIGAIWFVSGGPDHALMNIDAYAGYSFFGVLTLKLAAQFAKGFLPENYQHDAFAITPGVEVDLLDIIRLGVAVRIATNDNAKALYLGRANLLFHGGISF